MAEVVTPFVLAFQLLEGGILLASAAYFLSLRGNTQALRLYALALGAVGLGQLSALWVVWHYVVVWPNALAGWTVDGLWLYLTTYVSIAALMWLGSTFPGSPGPRERLAFRVAAAVVVLAAVCTFLGLFAPSVRRYLDAFDGVMDALLMLGLVAAARRATTKGELVAFAVPPATLLVIQGFFLPQYVLLPLGVPYAGHYRVEPAAWFADVPSTIETLAALGGTIVFLAFFSRRRVWLPLVIVALGAAWFGLYQVRPYALVTVALVFFALAPAHAAHRGGAFGVATERPRSAWIFATVSGATAFLLVLLAVDMFVPDSANAVVLASLAGLALGASVAWSLRPVHAALTITIDPTRGIHVTPRSAHDDTPPLGFGSLVAGRYRVQELLGEGGQARVYAARDETLARDVVLKVVPSAGGSHAARALREARLLAAVDHPNVARIHDVMQVDGATILVMQRVDGSNLATLLRSGKVPRADAQRLFDDIIAGLEAAHAAGVVHGDLKPDNVLVGRDGVAKLVDFGLGRETRADATVVAGGGGTFQYMSPEQLRGDVATPASDVYAAALVYYEMLTGTPARDVGRADALQLRALASGGELAPRGSTGDARADALLARALSVDPNARFAGARELREALM